MRRPESRPPLWDRLLRHHLPLAVLCGAACTATTALIRSDHLPYRWSLATAYAALVLLAATLAIGPLNLLRRRANPVSTDLRRDLGIWACVMGLLHTVIGLQVHMKSMWLYFFREISGPHAWSSRWDQFGAANYTGLAATLILSLLAALSNDRSLRWLGGRRWKNLQRWNYALFALVLAHGVLYQLIEKRSLPWPVVFAVFAVSTLMLQCAGILKTVRRPNPEDTLETPGAG